MSLKWLGTLLEKKFKMNKYKLELIVLKYSWMILNNKMKKFQFFATLKIKIPEDILYIYYLNILNNSITFLLIR